MQKNYDLREPGRSFAKPEADVSARQVDYIQCLSVKQPWAWLICAGFKDFENRNWPSPQMQAALRMRRGPVLIHAGMMPDRNWREICNEVKRIKGIDVPLNAPCGGLVGLSRIIGAFSGLDPDEDQNFWYQGPDAFKLATESARLFRKPIDFKGQLGFFNVPILGPLAEEIEYLKTQNLWPLLTK